MPLKRRVFTRLFIIQIPAPREVNATVAVSKTNILPVVVESGRESQMDLFYLFQRKPAGLRPHGEDGPWSMADVGRAFLARATAARARSAAALADELEATYRSWFEVKKL